MILLIRPKTSRLVPLIPRRIRLRTPRALLTPPLLLLPGKLQPKKIPRHPERIQINRLIRRLKPPLITTNPLRPTLRRRMVQPPKRQNPRAMKPKVVLTLLIAPAMKLLPPQALSQVPRLSLRLLIPISHLREEEAKRLMKLLISPKTSRLVRLTPRRAHRRIRPRATKTLLRLPRRPPQVKSQPETTLLLPERIQINRLTRRIKQQLKPPLITINPLRPTLRPRMVHPRKQQDQQENRDPRAATH
jgi:hypothetical protein